MLQTKKWLLSLLGLVFAGAAFAQSADPKFYKLDFVVKEVEGGKTVNARTFSTMLGAGPAGRENPGATIRSGAKVAVPIGGGSNFQFYDIGVNIDARDLREMQGEVSVLITVDISTVVPDGGQAPVTRQNKWSGAVLATVKKPTLVFASDDVSSKRQLQLELIATPVK